MEKTDIKSLNLEELTAFVESIGEKKVPGKTDLRVDAQKACGILFGDDQYFCGSH